MKTGGGGGGHLYTSFKVFLPFLYPETHGFFGKVLCKDSSKYVLLNESYTCLE